MSLEFTTGREAAMLGGTVAARGTPEAVESWREEYFRSFHPAGYGTRVSRTIQHDDGTVTVVVSRYNSCD